MKSGANGDGTLKVNDEATSTRESYRTNKDKENFSRQLGKVVDATSKKNPFTGPIQETDYELSIRLRGKKHEKEVKRAKRDAKKNLKEKKMKKISYFFLKK